MFPSKWKAPPRTEGVSVASRWDTMTRPAGASPTTQDDNRWLFFWAITQWNIHSSWSKTARQGIFEWFVVVWLRTNKRLLFPLLTSDVRGEGRMIAKRMCWALIDNNVHTTLSSRKQVTQVDWTLRLKAEGPWEPDPSMRPSAWVLSHSRWEAELQGDLGSAFTCLGFHRQHDQVLFTFTAHAEAKQNRKQTGPSFLEHNMSQTTGVFCLSEPHGKSKHPFRGTLATLWYETSLMIKGNKNGKSRVTKSRLFVNYGRSNDHICKKPFSWYGFEWIHIRNPSPSGN